MNSAEDQTTIVQCTIYKKASKDLCRKAKELSITRVYLLLMA